MKLLGTALLLFISLTSLFSQEFIKNAKLSFKDQSIVKGDFYFYPSVPNSVQVLDSTGAKKEYQVSDIDIVEGKTCILKNINFQGADKLFECVVVGEKLSLYKTNENDKLKLYAFKDNKLSWLECGKREFEVDSKKYSKEIVTYKGILKVLMNDNAYLANKADKIECTEKAVSDLVIAYNEGHILYFKNKAAEKMDRKPDWKIYSGYSNFSGSAYFIPYSTHRSLTGAPPMTFNTTSGAFGQIGTEFFPFEGSKHSFRFGLEYGKFYNRRIANPLDDWTIDQINKASFQYFNLNTSYYYDFIRMPKANIYLGIRLIDMGKLWGTTDNSFVFAPRISPGFGFEYHISKHMDVFGELNHLLKMKNYPHNFSFGISWDI